MKIAIHRNEKLFKHSTLWTTPWIQYCEQNGISYEVVDCYSNGILEKLKDFDCLLWHFSNYSYQDMLFARTILNAAKNLGLKTFPEPEACWHFDDKVAEMYLLQSADAPIPESYTFYTIEDLKNWAETYQSYPIVGKLRCGSGSSNVKLLKSKHDLISYGKKMFQKGYSPAPNLLYKTKSNVKSSKNWETFVKRFKRIPDFLETIKKSKMAPRERGYCYLQEFVPNDGFDLKIVVVGDKLSYIVRNTRKGDFRASGGGDLFFDKSYVTADIIKSAFETSERLGVLCMGYDYVVDKRTNTGKIVEMSYGFSHTALMGAEGYWTRDGVWHDEALNAPNEIIRCLTGEKKA